MKKTVTITLIPFLLLQLIGCSNGFEVITYDEITNNNDKIIEVTTFNSKTYAFSTRGYEIIRDTLFGYRGLEIVNEDLSIPFSGNIPLSDITSLKAKKSGSRISSYDFILVAVLVGIIIVVGYHITD